jgi:hypothetical protein
MNPRREELIRAGADKTGCGVRRVARLEQRSYEAGRVALPRRLGGWLNSNSALPGSGGGSGSGSRAICVGLRKARLGQGVPRVESLSGRYGDGCVLGQRRGGRHQPYFQ